MSAMAEKAAPRELSILELIARHPDQEGLRLMTVRSYFDGSGKSHDPKVGCVALAGYVGTEEVWADFEREFAVFAREHRIEYFHASELEAARGTYHNLSGHQAALVRAGLMEMLRGFERRDFSAVVYSVSMVAYREMKRTLPTPEAICGSGALDDLCRTIPPEHELQVFYDRSESFFPRLQDMWRNAKRRRADPRLDRISVFTEVSDWRKYPALQAADLLAWSVATGDLFQMDLAMLTADLAIYGKHYGAAELEEIELPLPFQGPVEKVLE